jgi:hypothetical protein
MGRNHSRLAFWVLAGVTALAVFGGQPAYAWDSHQPRVEGAGWFSTTNFTTFAQDEIKLGVNAKLNKLSVPDGRFEIMNKTNKFNVHGRVTNVTFHPATCGAFNAPNGQPAATIWGQCDDHAVCSQVQFDVVDNDSGGHNPDWVCNVHVHAVDEKGRTEDMDDPGDPMNHGHVEVHNYQ